MLEHAQGNRIDFAMHIRRVLRGSCVSGRGGGWSPPPVDALSGPGGGRFREGNYPFIITRFSEPPQGGRQIP